MNETFIFWTQIVFNFLSVRKSVCVFSQIPETLRRNQFTG